MNKTVLIVEDHLAVRATLKAWLETLFPDFDILDVGSGEEAVELVQNQPLNAIVMDIELPGINGIEAMRQIRTSVTDETPVIVLTIHEDKVFEADALSAGAIAFVPKRKMQSDLVTTLTSVLEGVD